jgi:hypothetical protein
MGMKSGVQDPLQAAKNSDNQVNPPEPPVTAGAPSWTPSFFNGCTLVIHVDAANEGDTSLPPVDEVPSGSLKVKTYEIFVPLEIRDLTVSRNVVLVGSAGAVNSIGTNWSELLSSCGEGEEA